jgi:hypothetical protein
MGKPLCFVIMPYGGDDGEKRKRYLAVFKTIIKPAAEAAGYHAKRSDIDAQPGDVVKDIIKDLARATVVVADLSGWVPNVFYELGIRHVLRKSGTILVFERGSRIPFDLAHVRAVEYGTDFVDVEEYVRQIRDAILRISPAQPDNPVHDTLPQLPPDLVGHVAGTVALRHGPHTQILERILFTHGGRLDENGWKMDKKWCAKLDFHVVYDPEGRVGSQVTASGRYALDYEFTDESANARHVRFVVRPPAGEFYLYVEVSVRSGANRGKPFYIAVKTGNGQPYPFGHGRTQWVFPLAPQPIGAGWLVFDVDLDRCFRVIGPKQGIAIEAMNGVRIQGNLAISLVECW